MTRPRQSDPPQAEAVRRAERAAASLSPLERDVLVLSAGLGLRIDDIAARLGLGKRRTERLLARALRRFDRAMAEPERSWWRRRSP